MSNIQLNYETYGEEGAPPMVILHGFLASSRNWRQIAKRLSQRFRVYVPDQRNHGASPHFERMDYPLMAADLATFMDRLNLESATLLGHSMGGKTAMWFALNYPERVSRLLVVDIAPVAYQHNFDRIIEALDRLPLASLSNRKQADDFLSEAIPDIGFRQFLLQNLILRDGQYAWRINLDYCQQSADYIVGFPSVEGVAGFVGEVLFITGENSTYFRPEAVSALFPNAAVATIANAGHWLHAEQPERFVKVVEDFVMDQFK
ncbi:MAG: alpha/beta fold hydrolase [Methylomicrobium sp.]|nr:alpha/beta fold hydrolase [Methylomicrobium sp.]